MLNDFKKTRCCTRNNARASVCVVNAKNNIAKETK